MSVSPSLSSSKTASNQRRYYSHALSEEDKEVLRSGQYRREWTAEDLISYRSQREKMGRQESHHLYSPNALENDSVEQKRDMERPVVKVHRLSIDFKTLANLSSPELSSPNTQSSGTTITVSPPTPPPHGPGTIDDLTRKTQPSTSKVSTRLIRRVDRTSTSLSFRRNPEITFDSILVNRTSGHDKTSKGAENTTKGEEDGGNRSRWRRSRWSSGFMRDGN